MGVPGFFSWLRRKYPQIVDECAKDQSQHGEGPEDRTCDNLYIGPITALHITLVQLLMFTGCSRRRSDLR